MGYPLIAKPIKGKGSVGIIKIYNDEDLLKAADSDDYIIQEYFNDKIPRYDRNIPYSKEAIANIIDFWNTLLDDKKLDFSEKLYFLEKHYIDAFLPLESEFDMQNFHKNVLVGEKAILVEKMLILVWQILIHL